eukprot:TRINITY_DN22380_c0_g1_i1.p1 TRINITY_DN22380_c0_g1~~TRINITY_DN22380_c0_g1_i1.p1  ORF type:complete len:606 (+),score=95.03 TRINITY_DN22380_c0_g1_i1:43-1860(+)
MDDFKRQVEVLLPSSDEEGEEDFVTKPQHQPSKSPARRKRDLVERGETVPIGKECNKTSEAEAELLRWRGEPSRRKTDLFAECNIGILIGDRAVGKVRGKIICDLIITHGGMVTDNLEQASHLVTGYHSRDRAETALGKPIPFKVAMCPPEWVSMSLSSKQLAPVTQQSVPEAVYTPFDFDVVATPAPEPPFKKTCFGPVVDVAENEQKVVATPETTPFKKKGFIPVFFASEFACQKGKNKMQEASPNSALIDELEKLHTTYANLGDSWRKYAYSKAIGIIKRWKTKITCKEDVAGARGIGGKIADKIQEILSTGTCLKIQVMEKSEEVQVVSTMGKIWGVGPTTAVRLYRMGIKTIKTLIEKQDEVLTKPQKIGLKYCDELQERIPRAEVELIRETVRKAVEKVSSNIEVEVCGSYRRGKSTCGDVDVLMCDKKGRHHDGMLACIADDLQSTGFLTDSLTISYKSSKTGEADMWFGVCQIPPCDNKNTCQLTHLSDICADNQTAVHHPNAHVHRRIDLKLYKKEHYPFAVLYFTGSNYFNRSMRLFCHKKGLTLSDRTLCPAVRVYRQSGREKVHEGEPIPCDSEQAIFDAIGLEYKTPLERDI